MNVSRLVFAAYLVLTTNPLARADAPRALPKTLEITKLPPAKLFPNLCLIKYRISTTSPECQAFFDQGLGYFYSYVWMEAARSFETAAHFDPNCAMAWWGLSRAMEHWGRGQHTTALKKAQDLLPATSHRESLLIKSRLEEKGMWPGTPGSARRKNAAKTLDELLTFYGDDEEGWFCRAKLSDGVAAVPYYKALLRVNPLHPGAHHELVHFYEGFHRPALGWPHAEKYMESSPGLPHAFHMQAHLAMRLGRWAKTTDWSARAIELQRAYHKDMEVKPGDDWQYSHHLEVLTQALVHDGRFHEARAIKKITQEAGYTPNVHWFRLHLAEHDWEEALRIARKLRPSDKLTASYMTALVYLRKSEPDRASPEVDVLQEGYRTRRNDKALELRLWETQGTLLCQRGEVEAGLKLLAKAVAKTKDDFGHHSWGQGAYYMEAWGMAALQAGKLDVAEEAFLEALAHDTGSARGALGMQIVCERQGRGEESARFAELAQRCWRRADPGCLPQELVALRQELPAAVVHPPEKTPAGAKR
jgi:tetratricopeptide (TPR) repeat protein